MPPHVAMTMRILQELGASYYQSKTQMFAMQDSKELRLAATRLHVHDFSLLLINSYHVVGLLFCARSAFLAQCRVAQGCVWVRAVPTGVVGGDKTNCFFARI